MSFEFPKVISEHLDKEKIAYALGGNLPSNEREVAVDAIQKSRTQEIADLAMMFLYDEAENLAQEEATLEQDLHEVRQSREQVVRIIGARTGDSKPKAYDDLRPPIKKIINMIDSYRPAEPDEAKKVFVENGPINIVIEDETHEYSISSVQRVPKPELKDRYGKNTRNCMTRMSSLVMDYLSHDYSNRLVSDLQTRGVINEIKLANEHVAEIKSFRIANPAEFYDELLKIKNVGPKVLLALCVIAEVQAQELAKDA